MTKSNRMNLIEGIKVVFELGINEHEQTLAEVLKRKDYSHVFHLHNYLSNDIIIQLMYVFRVDNSYRLAYEQVKKNAKKLDGVYTAINVKAECDLISLENIFYVLILANELDLAKAIIRELGYALGRQAGTSWQEDKVLMLIAAINDDSSSFIDAYKSYKSRSEIYIDQFLSINFDILKEVVENGVLDSNKVKQSLENFKSLQVDKKMKKDSSPLYGGGDYEPFVIHFLLMVIGVLASKKGLVIEIDDKYFPQELFKMLIIES